MNTGTTLQRVLGKALARYLNTVWITSTVVYHPDKRSFRPSSPSIIATWHGQHFMTPFVRERASSFLVPVAHGAFGSIYAQTFAELGLEVVRGSRHTGGFKAFREMIRALDNGASVGLTVDSQPVARVVGDGVLALARYSGRPIIPVATATSRQVVLTWRWDRPVINLPLGRLVVAIGRPISLSQELNREHLEDKRQELQRALCFLNLRAAELAKS